MVKLGKNVVGFMVCGMYLLFNTYSAISINKNISFKALLSVLLSVYNVNLTGKIFSFSFL